MAVNELLQAAADPDNQKLPTQSQTFSPWIYTRI
jgi:hypothetical protein